MDEYVLSSTIPGDEAEALVDIEPFHGALGAPVAPTRFAQDSLQEGNGFEPSVPRRNAHAPFARRPGEMVDPVIQAGPGDADAAIAHVCEVRQGSRPGGCSCRKVTRCLSKIEGGVVAAERGTARLRHQPISAGRNPISTLPADSYCARNALLC